MWSGMCRAVLIPNIEVNVVTRNVFREEGSGTPENMIGRRYSTMQQKHSDTHGVYGREKIGSPKSLFLLNFTPARCLYRYWSRFPTMRFRFLYLRTVPSKDYEQYLRTEKHYSNLSLRACSTILSFIVEVFNSYLHRLESTRRTSTLKHCCVGARLRSSDTLI